MADGKLLTPQDTIDLLNVKAKDLGDDFRVRVFRKRHAGALPESIATLDNAQVVHIANPETWLPKLAGGGPIFTLSVYHMSDSTLPLGGMISVAIPGTPREVDALAPKISGWNGPKTLVWPEVTASRLGEPSYSVAPSLSSFVTAPGTNVPSGGSGGGAFSHEFGMGRDYDRLREQLMAQERALGEERRRMELDGLRREHELRMKEMEMRLTNQPHQKTENSSGGIKDLIAAVAPVVSQMIQAQNEMRMQMMKLDADRASQTQQMLTVLMTKPLIDPAIQGLMDKAKGEQVPQAQMLSQMAEAMGAMTRTTMDLVQTAIDAGLGGRQQEDPPALKAIREGAKAITALMSGYQSSIQQQITGQNPALPAAIPAPQRVSSNGGHGAQVPVEPQPGGFNEMAQATPAVERVPPSIPGALGAIDGMIRAKAPVSQVAQTIINNLSDGGLQMALMAVDGNIDTLIERQFGDWIKSSPANGQYITSLFDEVNRLGTAAGIFDAEAEAESFDSDASAEA